MNLIEPSKLRGWQIGAMREALDARSKQLVLQRYAYQWAAKDINPNAMEFIVRMNAQILAYRLAAPKPYELEM